MSDDSLLAIPHILFVEDEPVILELVTEMLESMEYQVTCFDNSIDAFQSFSDNNNSYDLIITDNTMPGMTGIELVQKVRGVNTKVPIILTTGYSEEATENTIQDLGITALLIKPYKITQFHALIEQLLSDN